MHKHFRRASCARKYSEAQLMKWCLGIPFYARDIRPRLRRGLNKRTKRLWNAIFAEFQKMKDLFTRHKSYSDIVRPVRRVCIHLWIIIACDSDGNGDNDSSSQRFMQTLQVNSLHRRLACRTAGWPLLFNTYSIVIALTAAAASGLWMHK